MYLLIFLIDHHQTRIMEIIYEKIPKTAVRTQKVTFSKSRMTFWSLNDARYRRQRGGRGVKQMIYNDTEFVQ